MRAAAMSLMMAALFAVSAHPARANLVCRTELADGRVLLTEPVMGQDGIFCRRHNVFERRHDAFAERHEFATPTLPHMNFTTGEIGPFTTFSNSPPNGTPHHR
jgi:hypothetical protein